MAIASKQLSTSGSDRIQTSNLDDGVISSAKLGSVAGTGLTGGSGSAIAADDTVVAFLGLTQSFTGAKTFSTTVTMSGGATITGVPNPSAATEVANKQYVDTIAQGLDLKNSVRVATTSALPAYTPSGNILTADANGAFPTIDDVTLVVDDSILVKDEAGADAPYNGIYTLTTVGDGSTAWVLTRRDDADTDALVTSGLYTYVSEGTLNGATGWVLTTVDPIVLNTTDLAFTQFSGAGQIIAGNGITKSGNTLSVLPDPTNQTITATGSGISVKLDAASGLTAISTGLAINLAANPGLQITSNALKVKADATNAIQVTASGVGVIGTVSTADIKPLGTTSVGTPGKVAWADHIHARDAYVQDKFTASTTSQGTPTSYTLSENLVQNASLLVFLNGVALEQGASAGLGDYYISATNEFTFNGDIALTTSDIFIAYYYTYG